MNAAVNPATSLAAGRYVNAATSPAASGDGQPGAAEHEGRPGGADRDGPTGGAEHEGLLGGADRAVLRLEEIAARGWPAPQTEWLGRWLLRAGEGWTRRANSVLALGEPDRPLDAALAAVGRWYTARGLRASFSVPLPTQQPLDDELAARGWTIDMDTAVLTTDLAPAAPAALAQTGTTATAGDTPAGDTGVRLADRPPPGWAAVYRGGAALPSVAERILTAPSVVTFASITHRDHIVATGRGVVTDGWLGIAAVEVLPDHRRRGLARKITGALQAWGTLHGATRCYLQVMSSNAPRARAVRRPRLHPPSLLPAAHLHLTVAGHP